MLRITGTSEPKGLAPSQLVVNGSLGGTSNLTKTGTGTLILAGSNVGYTHDITVLGSTINYADMIHVANAIDLQNDGTRATL